MTEEICKNCGHDKEQHPNSFLCYAGEFNDCVCPGWVKRVVGINDEDDKKVEGVN